MKNILGIGLLAFLLSACGGSGYERYEGYWQQQQSEKSWPRIVQIVKEDSKTYLAKENLLPDSDGKVQEKSMVLTQKDDGTLAVDTGYGSIPLALSEDGKTLRTGSNTLTKITEDEFNATRQQIEQDLKRCEEIKQAYEVEKEATPRPQIGDDGAKWKQWETQHNAIKEKYKAQKEQLPPYVSCYF